MKKFLKLLAVFILISSSLFVTYYFTSKHLNSKNLDDINKNNFHNKNFYSNILTPISTWSGDIHTTNFYIGSDYYSITACPYITYDILNVSGSGTIIWDTSLSIAESVCINGNKTNLKNPYKIRNVEATIVAGDNTCFTSKSIGGKYLKDEKFSILSKKTPPDLENRLHYFLAGGYNTSANSVFDNDLYLNYGNSYGNTFNHHFYFAVDASTINSNLPKDVSTPSRIQWKFDLFFNHDLVKSYNHEEIQYYLSNSSQ